MTVQTFATKEELIKDIRGTFESSTYPAHTALTEVAGTIADKLESAMTRGTSPLDIDAGTVSMWREQATDLALGTYYRAREIWQEIGYPEPDHGITEVETIADAVVLAVEHYIAREVHTNLELTLEQYSRENIAELFSK